MKISGHKKFKQIWMMEHWSCLHWSFMTISSQIYSDIGILRLKSCIAASVLIVCLSPRLISGSSIIHMLTMFGVYICSLVSPTSNKQKSKNTEDEYLMFLLIFSSAFFIFLELSIVYQHCYLSPFKYQNIFLWETIPNGDALETKLIIGNASFCLMWYYKLTEEK